MADSVYSWCIPKCYCNMLATDFVVKIACKYSYQCNQFLLQESNTLQKQI